MSQDLLSLFPSMQSWKSHSQLPRKAGCAGVWEGRWPGTHGRGRSGTPVRALCSLPFPSIVTFCTWTSCPCLTVCAVVPAPSLISRATSVASPAPSSPADLQASWLLSLSHPFSPACDVYLASRSRLTLAAGESSDWLLQARWTPQLTMCECVFTCLLLSHTPFLETCYQEDKNRQTGDRQADR